MEMRWLRLQARRKFFCQHGGTTPKLNLTLEFVSLGVFVGDEFLRRPDDAGPENLSTRAAFDR
jgi:hypothetical protein